jgi:hypothetical protein
MGNDIYCIDSSSLIKLKRDYRPNVFRTLWEKVELLLNAGRLIAPIEVFEEVSKKDDDLARWARENKKKLFKRLDQKQVDLATEVQGKFPALANPGTFGPAADSFIIALARVQEQNLTGQLISSPARCVVVTEERGTGRIPGACNHYNLICLSLLELFEREGWEF